MFILKAMQKLDVISPRWPDDNIKASHIYHIGLAFFQKKDVFSFLFSVISNVPVIMRKL